MGFWDFVLSILGHLDTQPSSVMEAGSVQMDNYVHPVTTRRRDALPELAPQPRPQQDRTQFHHRQRRQEPRAAGTQEQGCQSPSQTSASPVASNEAVPSVPVAVSTGSQTKVSPTLPDQCAEASPSVGTTSPREHAHIGVCHTPTLSGHSSDQSVPASGNIAGSSSSSSQTPVNGDTTGNSRMTSIGSSSGSSNWSPGPCLLASGSSSGSRASAEVTSEEANAGAGASIIDAHNATNVKTTTKKSKKKKTRKVVKKRMVTKYEVHPLTLPPTVAVNPSTATVQVPTNTTLIMDMMDGVNRHLPSMASNVGPGEFYQPITEESLRRQREAQERRQQLLHRLEEQERLARITQGNGTSATDGGADISLFSSFSIWSNNLPAASNQQSTNGGSVQPPGLTSQWPTGSSANGNGNGTVSFGFGDLSAPFAQGSENGNGQSQWK